MISNEAIKIEKSDDKVSKAFMWSHATSINGGFMMIAATLGSYFSVYMTDTIVKLLQSHGICSENLPEKVHISINLIDDLCHEIVYHKHKCMNYDVMIDLVVDTIVGLIK